MRIEQDNGTIAFLKEEDRVIWADGGNDSAVILFFADKLSLPSEPIELLPIETRLPIGVEVAAGLVNCSRGIPFSCNALPH